MRLITAVAIAVLSGASCARAAEGTFVVPILKTDTNSFGQPISFPQGLGQIAVSMYEIPVGARLPVHEHPASRIGYVLNGAIQVTNAETGETHTFRKGEAILELVGIWHTGSNPGTEPTKLLVIDLQAKGAGDPTILRE
jgi:quercetin dioxygenase-like cupin family protein